MEPSINGLPCVETDETLITHMITDDKTERQAWLWGAYNLSSNDIRLCVLGNDRSQSALEHCITKYIYTIPEWPTFLVTDGWEGYQTSSLINLGYEHIAVKHTSGFIVGEYTTNHIESLWSEIKEFEFIKHRIKAKTNEKLQEWVDFCSWFWTTKGKDRVKLLAEILKSK